MSRASTTKTTDTRYELSNSPAKKLEMLKHEGNWSPDFKSFSTWMGSAWFNMDAFSVHKDINYATLGMKNA